MGLIGGYLVNEELIHGKDRTTGIVCIEQQDGYVEIFKQDNKGDVIVECRPSKYWVLSNKPLNKNFARLKGDLHYKYGVQFSERESFIKARNVWKNEDIYSIFNPKEATMINKGITYYKGLHPKDVSILSFDIETNGLKQDETSKLLLISNTFRKNGDIVRRLFAYDEFEDEGKMIEAWCNWVQEMNPSIICGHNIFTFDLPYLNFIAEQYGVSLTLGRNKSSLSFNTYESKFRKDGSQDLHYKKISCYGRELIDTLFLSIKYDVAAKKYESYGLKNIIKQEGLEVKDREFYDASQIRFKYKDKVEWEKIKKYCIHDSDDSLALFDLMIPPFFYMAQSIPKSFQLLIESATGSQINALLVRSYLQYAHSIPKATDVYNYEGAISLGIPGVYKNVLKIDVASLYPSIMLQYEVFDKDKDPYGNFLETLKYFTTERLKHKKLYKDTGNKYHDDVSGAYKILINSFYGFLGSSGLSFNSCKNAEFVTAKGREILQQTIEWATGNKYVE